jgi:hypothetical protein
MGRSLKPRQSIFCKTCGRGFLANPSSHRKYCCQRCAYDSKERVAHCVKKERGTAVCKNCGAKFKLKTCSGLGKFCCKRCARSFNGKRNILIALSTPRPPSKKIEHICHGCGKRFMALPSLNRKFCGTKCANTSNIMIMMKVMRDRGFLSVEKCYSRCRRGRYVIAGVEHFFRSGWEKIYAEFLQSRVDSGEIASWSYETQKFLFPQNDHGIQSYRVDFTITNKDGSEEYHEVKGWMDEKSKIKLALCAKHFPDKPVVIIGSPWFRIHHPNVFN